MKDTYLESSIVQSQEERLNQAHDNSMRAEYRIKTHEEVCAERYKQIQVTNDHIFTKLREIQTHFDQKMKVRDWLQGITLAAVLLGPGVAAEFLKKLVGM